MKPKSTNGFVRGISVRQPWAHSILFLGKDVENKPTRTHHRGPLLIQSSLGLEREEAEELRLDPEGLPRGAIIGLVEVVDCVRNYKSKFANKGAWHWVLRSPKALKKPIPYKGKLGIMLVPESVLKNAQFTKPSKQVALKQIKWERERDR